METTAILDSNNVVINIIMADPTDVPGSVDGYGGAIGDTWDGARFLRPEVPLTPLPERISEAWERIKHERDRRKSLGVKVGEHWYHSDADSRIQQLSLFVMGAAVPPVQWKTLTTSPPPVFVTMTPAIAAGIFLGTAASDAAIFGFTRQ